MTMKPINTQAPSAKPRGLSFKQAAFVAKYLVHFNATKAAVEAGYKARNASVVAYQLLHKTLVLAAIRDAQEQAKSAAIATLIESQEVLTEILRAKPFVLDADGKLVKDSQGAPIPTGIKTADRIAAIERLAKLCGWDAPSKAEIKNGGYLIVSSASQQLTPAEIEDAKKVKEHAP